MTVVRLRGAPVPRPRIYLRDLLVIGFYGFHRGTNYSPLINDVRVKNFRFPEIRRERVERHTETNSVPKSRIFILATLFRFGHEN